MARSQQHALWVNTLFQGPQLDEFLLVKAHLGIQTSTDVIRHLVHKAAREIRSSTPPMPRTPGTSSTQRAALR
jgi:hypothetical protein